MKSILLSAYAVSPTRGSEYGVGWNFSINLAKKNKVFLVCGASGEHLGDTEEIEEYFKKYPNVNISLIVVKPSTLVSFINWFNKKGLSPVFYLAFLLWQRQVFHCVKELISAEHIDLIHQLNPIGFREPGYLWKLKKPFVWGPIGGAQFVNPVLLTNLPVSYKYLILAKNMVTFLQLKYYSRVRKAAVRAKQLVFSTEENRINFEKFLGKTGLLISEQSSFASSHSGCDTSEDAEFQLKMVWIGRVVKIKNLVFLFHALALVFPRDRWRLRIIGDGPEVENLKELSLSLKISGNILWYGKKSQTEAISLIAGADLHVLSSLSEANTTVLYEAMSLGVPTISLDQNGMHTTLANGQGVLVPITTYNQTVEKFASEITSFITHPQSIVELKRKMTPLVNECSWVKKIDQFELIYDNAIKN
jgi:glycosyltransferase involved in cell wall biosynthesis